jgi:HEAT repeat protein
MIVSSRGFSLAVVTCILKELIVNSKRSLSVENLLQKLITEEGLPSIQELAALSDLSRPDWQLVRGLWSAIPEARRYQVVESLVDESYETLHIKLERLLRVALEDENAGVRRLAIQGLWEDTEDDLVGPLIHLLHNDPDQGVRAAAAAALGAFVLAGELEEIDASLAMRVEEALFAVLHSDTEMLEVQCRALESVAFSGERGVRQLIEDGYYSPYEEMQTSALIAMGRSADTRWRSLVSAELDNPVPEMRAEAARACGELEASNVLEELIELLSDQEKSVRLAAIFALGRIGGKAAEDALSAVILGDDPDEVEAAYNALDESAFYKGADTVAILDESEADLDSDDDYDNW